MYTLIILLCCMGFFMLYNTSKRAKLSSGGNYQKWLQSNTGIARRTGLLLIIASFSILVATCGWGVGMFTAVILLMAAAAYVIAISPLYYLRWPHIAALSICCLLLELFIF